MGFFSTAAFGYLSLLQISVASDGSSFSDHDGHDDGGGEHPLLHVTLLPHHPCLHYSTAHITPAPAPLPAWGRLGD